MDERPAEPSSIEAPVATPLLPLSCDSAQPFEERARFSGFQTPQMGVCGDLTWTDSLGDFYALPEGEETPSLIASGVTRRIANRRNDAFLVSADGATWTFRRAGVVSEPFDATQLGFVRDGEMEIAWACVGRSLGTVDEEGFSPRVDDVPLCERVITASDAPVFVFVGADFTLHAFDLRGPRLVDLSEVPYVAAASDALRLSHDGRVLAHQANGGRIGLFDLARDLGDRQIGAPQPAGSIHNLREAARASHVMAVVTEEGVVVVGPDARLYDYPEAMLLGLDPAGSGVLLGRPHEGANEVVFAQPGGRDRVLSEVGPNLRAIRVSDAGDTVVFASLDAESRYGTDAYVSYRFGTDRLVRPDLEERPNWVAANGSLLVFDRNGSHLLDPYGIPRRTFEQHPTLRDLDDDRVLALEQSGAQPTLTVVSTVTGEREVLLEASRWAGWGATRDGARVWAFHQVVDPEDPTIVETIVLSGRP
ncbi:MAG: hypothetical protein AB8I08_16340 [Sandaracinaceae bacterium]